MTPLERFQMMGAPALSDAELLTLLMPGAAPKTRLLPWARHLLESAGGLAPLLMDGVRPPAVNLRAEERATLSAVMELARRALSAELSRASAINSPHAAREMFQARLSALPVEVFEVAYLDTQLRLIEVRELARGTVAQTSVYPREVVRGAIELHSTAVIFAHNHPSGLPDPSRADEALTRQLKDALNLIDVRVLDHLVVARGRTVSMAEQGMC